jgi:hypothetical protein
VVSLEPAFEKVLEIPIGCDVSRWKMAMVVDDRLMLRVMVIEFSRRLCFEKEVVVDKRFHINESSMGEDARHKRGIVLGIFWNWKRSHVVLVTAMLPPSPDDKHHGEKSGGGDASRPEKGHPRSSIPVSTTVGSGTGTI